MSKITIRSGTIADSHTLRRVFELASHGLSPYLWRKAADQAGSFDELVQQRMLNKIQDPHQSFKVVEVSGRAAGGILTYCVTELSDGASQSPMMRSFDEVDDRVIGSVHINAIAVFPEYRRMGLASAMLEDARDCAALDGYPISLSVCDLNTSAIATYEAAGFEFTGRVKMEKEDWDGEGNFWLLMVDESACPWRGRAETNTIEAATHFHIRSEGQ